MLCYNCDESKEAGRGDTRTPSSKIDHLGQELTPSGTKFFTNFRPMKLDIIPLLVYLNVGLLKIVVKVRINAINLSPPKNRSINENRVSGGSAPIHSALFTGTGHLDDGLIPPRARLKAGPYDWGFEFIGRSSALEGSVEKAALAETEFESVMAELEAEIER